MGLDEEADIDEEAEMTATKDCRVRKPSKGVIEKAKEHLAIAFCILSLMPRKCQRMDVSTQSTGFYASQLFPSNAARTVTTATSSRSAGANNDDDNNDDDMLFDLYHD